MGEEPASCRMEPGPCMSSRSQLESIAAAPCNPMRQEVMDEEVHECIEAVGSGERHYTVLPSYPNFQASRHSTLH